MPSENVSVLFVDDEPHIIQALKRMMRAHRNEWAVHFADSGLAALDIIKTTHIDVIVADMRMPGMDGADLLKQVSVINPDAVRIILTGHSDQSLIVKAMPVTHQYLTKPWEPEALIATIRRAFLLRQTLNNESLRKAVAEAKALPSLPKLYVALTEILQQPTVDMRAVADVVTQDLAMVAKIMQMVNSSFFGLQNRIDDIVQAVTYLGADMLKALVLSAELFTAYKDEVKGAFSLEELSRHSMVVAKLAKSIATTAGANKKRVDSCFIAGLLHDIGKLVLLRNVPLFQTVMEQVQMGVNDCAAERQVFGVAHPEMGAHLLRTWGFADDIVEAAAFHDDAGHIECTHFAPMVAVQVADWLAQDKAEDASLPLPPWMQTVLDRFGWNEHLAPWRSLRDELMIGN